MSDVILINAPIVLYENKEDKRRNYFELGDERSFTPVNLLYLAAYLIEKGYTVKILDTTAQELTLVDLLYTVAMEKPKLIGISAMTPSIQAAVVMAKKLRSYNIPIVLGGVHITNDPTFIQRFPYFDYGVVGDGEIVLHEILQGKHQKGIIYAKRIEDLDILPFPAWHLVNLQDYRRKEMDQREPYHMDILTSRGCAFSCSFCSCPNSGNKVRFRSPKRIVDEIESKYDICKGYYIMNDDCFTLSKKHIMAVAQEIFDRNVKIKFIASTRADNMDDEIIRTIKKMGCIQLAIGCESGSERIRNEVLGKRISNKDLANTISLCRKHKIQTSLFLMAGFPTETKEDMQMTVDIGPKLMADHIGVHQTTPYPGSRLWNDCIKEGRIPIDLIDQWTRGERGKDFTKGWVYYIPDGFTQKDMIDFKRKTYLTFYFHPKWVIRKLWQAILHPIRFIKEDLQLFKILPFVIKYGGTKRQLN